MTTRPQSIRGLNAQTPPGGIEWTRVWGRNGYTWNPKSGCPHACTFTMPDGSEAICYAEAIANNLASSVYQHGFNHDYWKPEILDAPKRLTEPSGIFLDSMGDWMSKPVPSEHIEMLLQVMRDTPQHVYFTLTKNPKRLLDFEYPANCWIGVSVPPSGMYGKQLTWQQRQRMLDIQHRVFSELRDRVKVLWLSAEPLSVDLAQFIEDMPLDWIVVGAASNGRRVYQPEPSWVHNMNGLAKRRGLPLFYKGNLRGNRAATPWREEFPQQAPLSEQLDMF